jgi:NAD(P)-dependent dehydrogenase (short-subunit alcohol dehydrogenase family)
MNLDLKGDTAVIAGGAQGIGLAIGRGFAVEEAAVVLVDRDPRVIAAAEELAARHGVPAIGLVADVTDLAAIEAAAREVQSRLGRIDHVVCAAAIGSGKYGFPFWNLSPADWPRVLEVNVVGCANVLHAFVPALVEAQRGTVLVISSVAGQIGSQTDPPYSASKAAVINLAQCAAKDLAPHNVRVNTLCPGMVKTAVNRAVWESWAVQQTEANRTSYEAWAEEKIRRLVPLGRWQDVDDVANMAVFLASPRAKNVTGQTINVDGGFVMHW